MWLLTGLGAGPAGAAAFPAATVRLQAIRSTVTTHPARHGHKEGSLAVIVSVIGLGVIVVLLVLLGSLSARRRSRPPPPGRGWPDRGPGDGGRGLLG
jgi:hypothetical protein